jgi:unsaturated rhamnogalacturonyl hydrolase
MNTSKFTTAIASAFLLVLAGCADVSTKESAKTNFSSWPEGKSPQEIGQHVAQHLIDTPREKLRGFSSATITYQEVCAWYGALNFAKVTHDTQMKGAIVKRLEPLFTTQTNLIPLPDHVDRTVFAAVPLELYIQTKDTHYLAIGKDFADKQWGEPFNPQVSAEVWEYYGRGLSWQTRMWIDDMFMITLVQAQAYRATRNSEYLDRAAKEMVAYLDDLQRPNGLFYHAPDAPFFWGRGDGWMAAGMSELLRSLPKNHPDRPRIMEGYQKMMAALLKFQDANGMWHQLIDDPAAWPETSSTGMFTFAFITGVKEGWLDAETYGPAARKAWLGLTTYLTPDHDLREVCQGTGKYTRASGPDGHAYYLARPRIVGDLHGQAPVLWCATALLR